MLYEMGDVNSQSQQRLGSNEPALRSLSSELSPKSVFHLLKAFQASDGVDVDKKTWC